MKYSLQPFNADTVKIKHPNLLALRFESLFQVEMDKPEGTWTNVAIEWPLGDNCEIRHKVQLFCSWLTSVYLLAVLCCICIPSSLWPGTDAAGVPACPYPAVFRPGRQQRLVAGWVQRTERIRACQLPGQDVLCINT